MSLNDIITIFITAIISGLAAWLLTFTREHSRKEIVTNSALRLLILIHLKEDQISEEEKKVLRDDFKQLQ